MTYKGTGDDTTQELCYTHGATSSNNKGRPGFLLLKKHYDKENWHESKYPIY